MTQKPNRSDGARRALGFARKAFMGLCATTMLVASAAQATVALRVEARPAAPVGGATPINVYATVTSNGVPVTGLTAPNFTVTVNGATVSSAVSVPSVDPASTERASIVFVMDYSASVVSAAETEMRAAVSAFIDAMRDGDYAAIIKFNNSRGASVIAPGFTQIDNTNNPTALDAAIAFPYSGSGTNLLDALLLATAQFTAPGVTLPPGPRAIVVVTDGAENSSDPGVDINDAIAAANAGQISIFTVGVGNFTAATALLTQLADQTSGDFYPTPSPADIDNAYLQIETLLSSEYRLTFNSGISDCATHTLSVRANNNAGFDETSPIESFTRCAPLFAPNLTGLTRSEAITALQQVQLVLGTETLADSATIPEGSVVSQTPAANTQVTAQTAVNLVVSNGALRAVPDLANLTTAAATTALTNAGLVRGTITERNSATVPVGSVISHSPAAGQQVSNHSTVNLFVSSGPAPATSGGGGGGGATGLLEILGGLGLLAFARRRQVKKN